MRGTYIHENQTLDATFTNGGSDNPTNTLNTFKALASLAYGNDNRIVLTGQYFDTRGSQTRSCMPLILDVDAVQTATATSSRSPISRSLASQAPVWPWANARVGLQYTYYNKFDGDTVFAHDNNTLFGYVWFAM